MTIMVPSSLNIYSFMLILCTFTEPSSHDSENGTKMNYPLESQGGGGHHCDFTDGGSEAQRASCPGHMRACSKTGLEHHTRQSSLHTLSNVIFQNNLFITRTLNEVLSLKLIKPYFKTLKLRLIHIRGSCCILKSWW